MAQVKLKGALVSIHDVMPHNLKKIDYCIEQLKKNRIETCYLLVVPGLKWDDVSIARLRAYVNDGHELVAHGWVHQAANIRSIRHRIHSALISRDVAEHLNWSKSDAVSQMRRSRSWFADNQLPVPDFYVPPAWALGDLCMDDLTKTGFRYVETTTGIFDLYTRKMRLMPLVGYEARTLFSTTALKVSNVCNGILKHIFPSRPLRVAIHPDDFELYLTNSLREILPKVQQGTVERSLTTDTSPTVRKANLS